MEIFASLCDAAVLAHVLYGLPVPLHPRRRVTYRNGDDFGPSDSPPRPDRLTNLRVVGHDSVELLLAQGGATSEVFVDVPHSAAAPGWVVAESSPTFIELAAGRFHSYLEHEGLSGVLSTRDRDGVADAAGREIYSKHTKTAMPAEGHAVPLLMAPVGLPVEFTPDRELVRAGERLGVRLLVDGTAAPDRQVRVHHRRDGDTASRDVACVRTDGDGQVWVHVDAPGYWRFHAVEMRPHTDPAEADWRSHWACLTFYLP